MLHHQCPDVLTLMDLILSIPASTSDCERGFNVMKLVKSDWRSRLLGVDLSDHDGPAVSLLNRGF